MGSVKQIPKEQLEALHKQSFNNKDAIKKWVTLKCFFCCKRTISTFVKTFTMPRGRDTGTAICPNCGVDSLVPATTPDNILEAMHYYYFGEKYDNQ